MRIRIWILWINISSLVFQIKTNTAVYQTWICRIMVLIWIMDQEKKASIYITIWVKTSNLQVLILTGLTPQIHWWTIWKWELKTCNNSTWMEQVLIRKKDEIYKMTLLIACKGLILRMAHSSTASTYKTFNRVLARTINMRVNITKDTAV